MSNGLVSTLTIKANDQASGVIDGLGRKMQNVGKGAKISADVERLMRQLEQAQKGLAAVERVKQAQARVGEAKMASLDARNDMERAKRLLEKRQATVDHFNRVKESDPRRWEKWKTDGLVEGVEKNLAAAKKGFAAAEKGVNSATKAIEKQQKAAGEARRELNQLGVPFEKLHKHEAALRGAVEKTTAAIEKQTKAHRDQEEAAAKAKAEQDRFLRERARNVERRAAASSSAGHEARLGPTAGLAGSAARFGVAAAGIGGGAYVVGDQLRRAAKSSMDFERAMIEVGKATDVQGAELDAYGEKLMTLARTTGKTKEDLASMLSQAGFAGRPKEELMDFTEYAAKATVAWQTSAEDTGQALAEIGNIYEANQKRIEQIGDAINTMADNSASRETDLLEFMRRAGASSRQAGISAEHMLAFGAAMKEVGVRNEVAATGFEALLNVMKLGEEFSKKAGDGLKGLGINSTKMRKAFVAKPIETMIGVLEKLNDVSDPLKKAEIMTNLFGKEYQDDIAKMLNALPKLKQYIALMGDASKIAAGGVRFQFAQNLDKDVSKIDRATQAIDVLYKRLGDPIKVGAGGIAEQINGFVDRLEKGDTLLQRIIGRLTGNDGSQGNKPMELPKVDGEHTAEEWFEKNMPWLSGKKWNEWIDGSVGATGKEARQKYLDDRARERDAKEHGTLNRPGEIEGQIQRRQAVLDRARERAAGAPGIQRDMAQAQVGKSEAEIARLRGDLEKAWEAVGELRLQQKKDRGTFGLDGPGGKDPGGIVPGSFGLGMNGTQNYAPRNVPLPPQKPPELGDAAPKVDTSQIEAVKPKADEAKSAVEGLNVTAKPNVDASSIASANAAVEQLLANLARVGPAAAGAASQVRAANGQLQARTSRSFSDGVTPGAGAQ